MYKNVTGVAALVCGLALTFSGAALAEGPSCGAEQDDSWMQPEAIQELVEGLGYTVENFGVSEGNCYEMSGMNVQGQPVTAFLDPRTGDVLQEDIVE